VVAEILLAFGYHLGNDLNNASDNLTFTLLFKRPAWFMKQHRKSRQMATGLRILQRSLTGEGTLGLKERFFISQACRQMSKSGHNPEGEGKGRWAYERLPFIMNPVCPEPGSITGWGWKEPNSHLLLPFYGDHFGPFRYIHTIRHGLDMAYSTNQQQLYNWGSMFNIGTPSLPSEVPQASFRYWVEANRKAMEWGEKLGKDHFLALNFDEICRDPGPGLKEIIDFLEISPGAESIVKAHHLPSLPASTGRYRDHSLDGFREDDLEYLVKLGFDL
jgi:hypothetical protein